MTRRRADVRLACAAAALAGALGYAVFGPAPPTGLESGRGGADAWNLPQGGAVEAAAAQAAWNEVDPWGLRPIAGPEEAAPVAPPAVPIGIVREGRRWVAVFLQDGAEQRVGAGEGLSGGGQVRSVDALEVEWVDAEGGEHVRRLLSDPVPAMPSGTSPPDMTEDRSTQ